MCKLFFEDATENSKWPPEVKSAKTSQKLCKFYNRIPHDMEIHVQVT